MINSLLRPVKYLFLRNRKLYRQIKSELGVLPNNQKIFQIALTHRSASIKTEDGTLINNERLEFLGDAILGAVIADFLFKKYPNENEGFLTQMRSKIVKREYLNSLSKEIGLNKLLVSHITNGSNKKNIYGDALEAFIGAVYYDRGYEFTRKYILNFLIAQHIDLDLLVRTNTNYKSQLVEWSQKNKLELCIDTDTNPLDKEQFISYIRIDKEITGFGEGRSKKEAEQNAAGQALVALKVINKKA